MTGKFELEYEGELKGADHVGRELVRGGGFDRSSTAIFPTSTCGQIVEWFDLGGTLNARRRRVGPRSRVQARARAGIDRTRASGRHCHLTPRRPCSPPASISSSRASTRKRRSARTENGGYHGTANSRAAENTTRTPVLTPEDDDDGCAAGAEEEAVLQLRSSRFKVQISDQGPHPLERPGVLHDLNCELEL